MSPKVFEFSDPHEYVVALFAEKKRGNTKYSMRAWSKKLGYQSPSYVCQVLNGEKPVSLELAMRVAKDEGLRANEQRYFESICLAASESDAQKKLFYKELARERNPHCVHHDVDLDQFRFISEWYHSVLLELVDMPEFSEDWQEVSHIFGDDLNEMQFRRSVARLIRLKLLYRDESGKLRREHERVLANSSVPNTAIRKHHRQMIEKAIEAIEGQAVDERHLSGTTFLVDEAGLQEVKNMIETFHERVHKISRQRGSSRLLYRVNVQLFKIAEALDDSLDTDEKHTT